MSRNHWSTCIRRSKSYVHAVPPSNFQICCIDLWLNTTAHRDFSYSNIYPCLKRGIDRFSFFACFSLLPFPHTISPYPFASPFSRWLVVPELIVPTSSYKQWNFPSPCFRMFPQTASHSNRVHLMIVVWDNSIIIQSGLSDTQAHLNNRKITFRDTKDIGLDMHDTRT